MTISTKPPKKEEIIKKEEAIKQVIKAGGSIATTEEKKDRITRKMITMKIKTDLLERIDSCVQQERLRNYNFNRQQWIIEAIEAKLSS